MNDFNEEEKIRGKAYRRFQERKKKSWAYNLLDKIFGFSKEQIDKKTVGKISHTPHNCSCDMCKNKRRIEWSSGKDKLTKKEIISLQKLREGKKEYYSGLHDFE